MARARRTVPGAEGLDAEPEPIEVGTRWGSPWSTGAKVELRPIGRARSGPGNGQAFTVTHSSG